MTTTIVYHGKCCGVPECGVELTSINRYGQSLLCREHGLKNERERKKRVRETEQPRDPRANPADDTLRGPPLPVGFHLAFCAWLADPGAPSTVLRLVAEMDEYELRHRIRRSLPPVPRPQSTNPGA